METMTDTVAQAPSPTPNLLPCPSQHDLQHSSPLPLPTGYYRCLLETIEETTIDKQSIHRGFRVQAAPIVELIDLDQCDEAHQLTLVIPTSKAPLNETKCLTLLILSLPGQDSGRASPTVQLNPSVYTQIFFGNLYDTSPPEYGSVTHHTLDNELEFSELHSEVNHLGLPTFHGLFELSDTSFCVLLSHPRVSLADILTYSGSTSAVLFGADPAAWALFQLSRTIERIQDCGANVTRLLSQHTYVTHGGDIAMLGFLPALFSTKLGPTGEVPFLRTAAEQWRQGKMSNMEYISFLNACAGRQAHCPFKSFVFPWVSDFCGGHRDLTKSKARLCKGDPQLEALYRSTGYHVDEPLTDHAFFTVTARQTRKAALRRWVRQQWVPGEYPLTMRDIYISTPCEAPLEVFTDPRIFTSIHPDMANISLPSGFKTAEHFIEWHATQLEMGHVSESLHQWIDLVFGYQLQGEASIQALNVPRQTVDRGMRFAGCECLFTLPHPSKRAPDHVWVRFLQRHGHITPRATFTSSTVLAYLDVVFQVLVSAPLLVPDPCTGQWTLRQKDLTTKERIIFRRFRPLIEAGSLDGIERLFPHVLASVWDVVASLKRSGDLSNTALFDLNHAALFLPVAILDTLLRALPSQTAQTHLLRLTPRLLTHLSAEHYVSRLLKRLEGLDPSEIGALLEDSFTQMLILFIDRKLLLNRVFPVVISTMHRAVTEAVTNCCDESIQACRSVASCTARWMCLLGVSTFEPTITRLAPMMGSGPPPGFIEPIFLQVAAYFGPAVVGAGLAPMLIRSFGSVPQPALCGLIATVVTSLTMCNSVGVYDNLIRTAPMLIPVLVDAVENEDETLLHYFTPLLQLLQKYASTSVVEPFIETVRATLTCATTTKAIAFAHNFFQSLAASSDSSPIIRRPGSPSAPGLPIAPIPNAYEYDQALMDHTHEWLIPEGYLQGVPDFTSLFDPSRPLDGLVQAKGRLHNAAITTIAFSPSADVVITAGRDKTVRIGSVSAKVSQLARYSEHSGPVCGVCLLNDRLASVDGNLHVFSFEGQRIRVLSAQGAEKFTTLCAGFRSALVMGTNKGNIQLLDDRSGEKVAFRLFGSGSVRSVAASGYSVVATGNGGLACLLDTRSGRVQHSWRCNDSPIDTVAFYKDGILAPSPQRSVTLWDMTQVTPKPKRKFSGFPDSISLIAPCPLTESFLVGSIFNKVSRICMKSRQPPHSVKFKTMSTLSALAAHPYLNMAMLGFDDGNLSIVC